MSEIIDFQELSEARLDIRPAPDASGYSIADLASGAIDTQGADALGALLQFEATQPQPVVKAEQLQDWSNQELASLYRAQRLLALTGVRFDVDRGCTDEGDPWFVFIGEDDQVMVHFARIDGRYLLDSTAQSALITAASLEDLVEGFARRNHSIDVSGDVSAVDQTVVSLAGTRRASKVLMHPAMALAALVWSVHVFADGLVLPAAYKRDEALSDLTVPPLGDVSQPALLAALSDRDMDAGGGQELGELAQDAGPREQSNSANILVMGQGGIAPTATLMGLGLTTLAMSYGIHLWAVPNLVLPTADEQKTAIAALLLGAEITGEDAAPIEAPKDELAQAAEGGADTEATIAVAALPAQEAEAVETGASEVEQIQAFLEALQTASIVLDISDEIDSEGADPREAAAPDLVAETVSVPQATEEAVVASQSQAAETAVTPEIVFATALSQQSFFGELTTVSVLEMEDLAELASGIPTVASIFDDDGLIIDGRDNAEGATLDPIFPVFDQSAYDFVVYLMMKTDAPQRSNFNDEVILIDMTAFSATDGEIYARTWTFEDGSMISTLGLKSDFDAFGLVA